MDFYPNTTPETDNDKQNNINNTLNGDNQYDLSSADDTMQNMNSVSGQEQGQPPYLSSAQSPYQVQPPYGNNTQSPHQVQPPYGNNSQSPHQVQPPYGNSSQSQYQVQQPYGNEGRYPYQNGSHYPNNNGNPYYGNPVQNGNPMQGANYGRYAYPVNVSEPGSKLSTAAMVLGIISIITFFTFTVYPAFITGSIAIVLALLSKGRRPKLLSHARIGIICAVIGLVSNVLLITGTIVRYNTDENFREEVNRTFEELYGQSFDEMLEEILEDSGYTD